MFACLGTSHPGGDQPPFRVDDVSAEEAFELIQEPFGVLHPASPPVAADRGEAGGAATSLGISDRSGEAVSERPRVTTAMGSPMLPRPMSDSGRRATSTLSEHASKQLLAGYGVPVAREVLAATADDAAQAAESSPSSPPPSWCRRTAPTAIRGPWE
jgi:hypothetical protein